MNEYHFAEQLLLRAPARSWREYFVQEQQHLADPLLQAAIYIASPQFYECLKQKQFNVAGLSAKERLTLNKYINRSCFRAIPFGLFAGVSLIHWGEHYEIDLPDIIPAYVKIFPDQGWVATQSTGLLQQEFNENCRYETNPTLYKLLDEYRFVSTEVETGGTKRKYLLQSTDYTLILQELAQYCRTARYAVEVVSKICQLAGCSDAIGADYYSFLREEQFLVVECRPTITGAEHVAALLASPESRVHRSVRSELLQTHLTQLNSLISLEPEHIKTINKQFNDLSTGNPNDDSKNNLYVILNRPLPFGSVPSRYQEHIREGLFALDRLQGNALVPAMDQFARSFQRDFEGQTLDLLYALDPEVGIGYYAEENPPNLLLETLQFGGSDDRDSPFSWTDAQRFLLEKWHSPDCRRGSVIVITEQELRSIKVPQKNEAILGLSVLFRVAGQALYLESAGGVNAPALLGRFTIAGEDIKNAARKMASEIEAANPDVIFAEILHLSGTHTDNVNRRETIWSYEIPITAASSLPSEKQISLDELRIKVVDGYIVLFSEKHNKIVIPRLTSAYNHTIDKLPLFRFLVDVSYQYGQFSLGLDLRQYFPGLTYYPRVTYKRCILFLATWVLTATQIKEIIAEEIQAEKMAFSPTLASLDLPKVYSLMEGDQQLVFFRDKPNDLQLFRDCIRQKNEVVIKEFLLDENDAPEATNTEAPCFVHQFNAYLLPAEPIRLPALGSPMMQRKNAIRRMMPGSEWLYLKIYTSRNSSSKMLLKVIPLLRRRYSGRKIQKWFFVRYEDHAPHIRLRIQMAPEDISQLLIAFKKALETGVYQHVVREYQIDVYNRELERYRAGGIGQTESFFWVSSELAVRFLKIQEQQPTIPVHELTIRTAWDMIAAFFPALPDQLSFVEKSYQQYLAEFDHKTFKFELGQKYRELTPVIRRILGEDDYYALNGLFQPGRRFIRSINDLAGSVAAEDPQREDFLQSIIHLHLNRFFVTEPRMQELIVYFLLYKFLLSKTARSRQTS